MWPFKRKPVHVGPTSVSWQPGDMAECINGVWPHPTGVDPKTGDRLMVREVIYGADSGLAAFCLRFFGPCTNSAYDTRGFRKIVLTETGADRKVAAPLRLSAPSGER